jgi:hypothetical protein
MTPQPETSNTFWLNVPSTMVVAGPSFSGKSTEVARLCENWSKSTRNEQELKEIYVYYDLYQPELYGKIERSCDRCHFKQGFPDDFGFLEESRDDYSDPQVGRMIILDDLAYGIEKNAMNLHRLFTVLSHHTNTTVILIVQDLFSTKAMRTILKNTRYLFLTKSHYDWSTLQRLLFVGQPGVLKSAADDCFYKQKRNYLMVDSSSDCPPNDRLKNLGLECDYGLIFKPA